ncbi:50S ribosomal subunit protein L28 [Candidatus Nasuia deltocephalinicola str. NAS-ALF]|uniref:50S ribosomal subunit protein L28 n=1 Tax=Candidatus Nasuia deltocephalinicola str. NAS-ALF TaxID=1343077 RepID=S5SY75_9PROT|nr:50S ribosomal subunit protein L28 [Candidatus Nasuia deltocephalinicola str. NAS-ALF]
MQYLKGNKISNSNRKTRKFFLKSKKKIKINFKNLKIFNEKKYNFIKI